MVSIVKTAEEYIVLARTKPREGTVYMKLEWNELEQVISLLKEQLNNRGGENDSGKA